MSFTLPENPKGLDLSYKADLDFCDCFEMEKNSFFVIVLKWKKICLITEEIWYFENAVLLNKLIYPLKITFPTEI